MSIQNEPDYTASYDSCNWTAAQFHDFLAVLGPTFAQRGLTTKIMVPEESGWHFELASAALSDPATAQYLAIVAGHDYDGGLGTVPQASGKQLWETETSDFNAFDAGMGSGLQYATQIYNFLTVAQANAWNYWWLKSGNNDNEGLLGSSGQVTKRLYTVGNYSKFIRPGYYRIGETDDGGVLISAYKDLSTGKFVIVAVNSGSNQSETINLNGFTATSVTPWVTSASLNLAQQTGVAVNGSSFTYTLPAGSVTTFVGTARPVTAPVAPTGLTSSANNGQVALSWTAPTGAVSYNVYRSTTSGGEGATPYRTGITSPAFTDTGLTNGTTYYYQVTAVNGGGESPKSSQVSATPQLTTPSAPTGLTATGGNGQVALSWTPSTGAASYNVYRSTTSGGEGGTAYATGITSTTLTDTGLANGTTYYYQVTAVNPAGQSPKSGEASGTPSAVPGKLTGTIIGTPGSYNNNGTTTAMAFDGNFNTYFDAPAPGNGDWVGLDLGTAAQITQVKYAPRATFESRMVGGVIQGSNTADFSSGVVTLFTVTTVPVSGAFTAQPITNTGTFRYVRYLAPNGTYGDIAELEFDGTLATSSPPAAPSGLAATSGNAQVALTWAASTGTTSYNVYRSTTSGGEGTTPYATGITSTTFTNTGLANGTTYYYQVTAVNGGGEARSRARCPRRLR